MSAKILRLPTSRKIRQQTHYRPEPLNPARMAWFTPRQPLARRIASHIPWWVNEGAKVALGLACVAVWWVITPSWSVF